MKHRLIHSKPKIIYNNDTSPQLLLLFRIVSNFFDYNIFKQINVMNVISCFLIISSHSIQFLLQIVVIVK